VRVCLVAGLGMFIPALPAFAEVLVVTGTPPSHTVFTSISLHDPKLLAVQASASIAPPQDRSDATELLMLVAGLTFVGMATLWRS